MMFLCFLENFLLLSQELSKMYSMKIVFVSNFSVVRFLLRSFECFVVTGFIADSPNCSIKSLRVRRLEYVNKRMFPPNEDSIMELA